MNCPTKFHFCLFLLALISTPPAFAQSAMGRFSNSNVESSLEDATTIAEAAHAVVSSDNNLGETIATATSTTHISDNQIKNYVADLPMPRREKYYKTLELVKISWPGLMGQAGDRFGTRLIVGLNKPYYRLKGDMRVLGSFDLKLDNIVFGFLSSTKITLKYDLRRTHADDSADMKIQMDMITFKIGIPLALSSR
jgi:hypothetical protein